MKAVWMGVELTNDAKTIVVENNHYFPASSLKMEYFKPSSKTSTCPWKGEAHYYSIEVKGKNNKDAAWYYPKPKDAAKNITGMVAFWNGVVVE